MQTRTTPNNSRHRFQAAQNNTDNESNSHPSISTDHKHEEREARKTLVIWRRPLITLYYFILECAIQLRMIISKLKHHKVTVALLSMLAISLYLLTNYEGPHSSFFKSSEKLIFWCAYWVGLGVLSSVGLGTGLHTFLLYLGPHIAAVTLAAFECMSVEFPEPPYPDEIVCPPKAEMTMSVWQIISKVRLEAFMWGAGTAIGELPPYFMARAARLSGMDPDDEDYEEALHLQDEADVHTLAGRIKLGMKNLVQKAGFFGIMLAASIPNPLFDLAGITCGHFLVPFWTFFGATLIGKAIVKMHIQKMFVIMVFSKHHVEMLVDWMGAIPKFGPGLQAPFKDFLLKQKQNLHHAPGTNIQTSQSWLQAIFEKVIIAMVLYFVISIINSFAQSYMARLQKSNRRLKDEK